jgi:quercetin dioxygenase-like cupin family protein
VGHRGRQIDHDACLIYKHRRIKMFLKGNLNIPDDTQELADGSKLETVSLGDLSLSRVTLQPGWSWEKHIKPMVGTDSCQVPHQQIIVSGRAGFRMDDGYEVEVGPGDVLMVGPGHHAWVIGDEPVIAYDFFTVGTGGIADVIGAQGPED